MGNFYQQRANYITSGTSPEDYETLPTSLTYDNLVTYSYDAATSGGGMPVGLSSEIISEFSATLREIDLANQGKVLLYQSISAEATQDKIAYDSASTYNVSVIQGAPTAGPQV